MSSDALSPRYSRLCPSPRYLASLEACKRFHKQRKAFAGNRTWRLYPTLLSLCKLHAAKTLLDYGCGKGVQFSQRNVRIKRLGVVPSLAEGLGVAISGYDPAWPEYENLPDGCFDGCYVVDVLSCVPAEDRGWVISEIFSKARSFVAINLSLCEMCSSPLGGVSAASEHLSGLEYMAGDTPIVPTCSTPRRKAKNKPNPPIDWNLSRWWRVIAKANPRGLDCVLRVCVAGSPWSVWRYQNGAWGAFPGGQFWPTDIMGGQICPSPPEPYSNRNDPSTPQNHERAEG